MNEPLFTKPFNQLSKANVDQAGGKGASLGEMTRAGIPVPPGFVVLSAAFEYFLAETDLNVELEAVLEQVDHSQMHQVENASEKIQALILNAAMPASIAVEIKTAHAVLGAEFVAVRSSATSEDSADAAWAGQLESYLNTTEEKVLHNVQRCWASLFTPRAIFYRFEKGLHGKSISVAVVVQKMIQSEVSGIAFSVHPVTQDYDQLIIEAGFGLGEAIVSGSITPDSYVAQKSTHALLDTNIATQERGLFKKADGGNEWLDIPASKGEQQKLSNQEILELTQLIIKIEKHYGFPVDVEWAQEQKKFYIVQSRPITTLQKIEPAKPVLPRWEKVLQRNFPPLGWSGGAQSEFKGLTIGPLHWVRDREMHVRYKTVQSYMIQDPAAYYISNINELLDKEYPDFEKAIDEVNREVHAAVRVGPGNDLATLKKLNDLHTYMYGVMLVGFDVAIDIKAKIDAVITTTDPDFQAYLVTPSEKTAVQREQEAISAVTKKPSEAGLKRLVKEFGYLHQDYLGQPWTEEDYKKALSDNVSLQSGMEDGFDISGYSAYEQYLLRVFKKISYMYEEGRNAMVRAAWAMKETVMALGHDPQKILYMTEAEVGDFATGKISFISDELFAKRKEAFAIYFEAGAYHEYTGNDEVWQLIQEQDIEDFWNQKTPTDGALKGMSAYKGKVTGTVRLVFTQADANSVQEGEVLVSPMTQVEFLSGIRKCVAIVTDEGGIICHAAIVAREMQKPCVIGTKHATAVLKNGDRVEVDADNGIVRILKGSGGGAANQKDHFIKAYTRDFSIIMQQAWYYGNSVGFAKLLGIPSVEHDPPYIYFMKDGVVEVWENQQALEWAIDVLLKKLESDRAFFHQIYKNYFEKVAALEAMWTQSITTADQLHVVLEKVYEATAHFMVIYAAMDQRMPQEYREMALKMREKDAFFDATDRLLRQTLKKFYPNLDGLEVYIAREEVADTAPGLAELQQRNQGFGLIPGIFVGAMAFEDLVRQHPEFIFEQDNADKGASFLKGEVAFKGKVQGRVKILKRKDQINEVQEGDIIVSPMTTPDFLPAMKKAAAFVTEEGGITCHAAIVARELKKPCITGTKIATKVLKDGDLVEVDADKGIVRILKNASPEELWDKRWERGLKIQKGIDYARSIGTPFQKLFGKGMFNWLYVLEENGASAMYDKKSEQQAFDDFYLNKFEEKDFFTVFDIYEDYYQPHLKFLEKVQKKDLSKLDTAAFLTLFYDYKTSLADFFVPIWAIVIWEQLIELTLYKILRKHFTPAEIEEKALLVLSPTLINYLMREELDLYEISKLPAKKRAAALQKHRDTYAYIPMYDYDYAPYELSYFEKRLTELDADKLREKQAQVEKNKDRFEALLTTKELDAFDALRLKVINFLFNHKDQRSHYRSLESFLGQKLYAEIAQRLNVSISDVLLLTDDEITGLLKKEPATLDIASRAKKHAYTYVNGAVAIYAGSVMDEYLARTTKTIAQNEIKGLSVSPGVVSGPVRIIKTIQDLASIKAGDVLVTAMTRPDYVSAMKQCAAIVTDEGGLLCHAAIVSRELNLPCIVGTKNATAVLKNSDLVEVDADKGIVRILKTTESAPDKLVINNQEWTLTITRNMSFWHEHLSNKAYYFQTRNFGVDAELVQLSVTENGTRTHLFSNPENLKKYTQAILQAVDSEKKIVALKKKYFTFANALLKSLQNVDRKLTEKNLAAFFDAYQQFTAGLNLTAFLGRAALEELSLELKNEGVAEAAIPELVSTITYPAEHTPLFDSQLALLKIGAAVQAKKLTSAKIRVQLEKWLNDYGVIPVNYCDEPWTLENAQQQLNDYLKKDCAAELVLAQKGHAKRIKAAATALKKIANPRIKVLSLALAEGTYLNEFRKNIFSKVSLGFRDMFAIIARGGGSANWRDCFYLLPTEMLAIVKGEKIHIAQIVAQRKQVGELMTTDGTLRFLDTAELTQALEHLKSLHGGAPKTDAAVPEKEIKGFAVSRGIVRGIARIILGSADFHRLHAGEILVTTMTSVDFVPIMGKAAAFVTNEGGITSHASIVAREMNKPCVIGTKIGTKVLKDGDLVEVDANVGVIRILKSESASSSPTFFDGHEWYLAVTRNMSFWHELLSNEGHFHHTKDFGVPAQLQWLVVTERGTYTSCFLYQPNFGEYATAVMNAVASKEQIGALKQRYETLAQELLGSLTAFQKNLTEETYISFTDIYKRFCAGLMLTATIGRVGGERLAEKLKTVGIADSAIAETIGIITYPAEHTPLFDSRLELLKIAVQLQQKEITESEVESLLQAWLTRFGHIPVNFCEDPWALADAKEQFESLLTGNCAEELKELQKSHTDRISNAARTLQKLNNPEVTILATAIAEGTYINEFRKNVFSIVSLGYRSVFAKVAKQAGSSNWRDCFYLTPDEMRQIITGAKIDLPTLVATRSLVGYYIDDVGRTVMLDDTTTVRFRDFVAAPKVSGSGGDESSTIIKGHSANGGKVTGTVKIILESKEFRKLNPGDILVTTMTSVDFVPVMQKAAAFVTNEGGITSHASIVAREMNKPCIIGTKIATKVLKDGDIVEVDADKGVVRIIS